ncbi:MAG TPA: transglycosylase SLT domain-containing protein [Gemmatimonadaceae bacterium]|nr:transglycosylase SLT domain-containing protein [Gemmatimonadaceae bacterium]
MKDLRGTYVRRGDIVRRRRRVRAGFMFAGFVLTAWLAATNWEPSVASALPPASLGTRLGLGGSDSAEVHYSEGLLRRWHQIFGYARRYRISVELAQAIHDIAVEEGIDPALAFPLVRLESRFDERATSPAGAIGLTQLMPATARAYIPDVTVEQLYDRETNLRIGFRYLRDLIAAYRDVQLALLVYNRGPAAVQFDRELGIDPSNGYDRIVLRGYRGKGILERPVARSGN